MIDACALTQGYDVAVLRSVDHRVAPREAVLQMSWQRSLRAVPGDGGCGRAGKEDHGVSS